MKLQPPDFAALAAELADTFYGARVQKAWSVARSVCVLQLRERAGHPERAKRVEGSAAPTLLLIRAGSGFGRISLLKDRPPLKEDPHPFQALLRRHLEGAALESAEVFGRRVHLHFQRGEATLVLLAEMDGGGALAVIIDGRSRALDAPRGMAPKDLLPGEAWSRPAESSVAPAGALTLATAEEKVGAAERAAAAKELTRPLKQKLERTLRTLEKIRSDLNRGGDADTHRRHGELLKANLHRAKKGLTQLEVDDWDDEGTARKVTLRLDPKKTGPEQVAWCFHQAKRLERGAEVAKERLLKLEKEAKALEQQLAAPPDAPWFVELKEAPAADAPSPASPFREYTVHGGYRVRVGKGPKHNDTLTLKLSKPDDVWLHARGAGGAHVVLSLPKGETVPQEALLDAAHLALHHSSLKGEPSGEVTWTRAKYVRKPKGAAPGAVLVTQDKTVHVRVEPERLTRLLSAEV